jgi:hypothetical protein
MNLILSLSQKELESAHPNHPKNDVDQAFITEVRVQLAILDIS